MIATIALWPRLSLAQPEVEQSIVVGELVQGYLSEEDGTDPYRGNRADFYTFEAYAGQRLELLLTSEIVDTFLILRNPAGVRLTEDDDGAGDLDSRILVTIPIDGLYTAIATTFGPDETGPYELLIREFHPTPVHPEPLSRSRPTHGNLSDTDASRSDSRRIDGYTFDATAGERIRIRATSETIDTYLYLLGPTGEVLAENDDGPAGGTDSEIAVEVPHPGQYEVLVSSFAPAYGDYVVELDVVEPRPLVQTPVTLGVPQAGRLAADDGTWAARGTYADGYTFEGERGQQVQIALTSTEIDAFVVLLGPDGTVLARNDDSGGATDSLISTRLPTDGTYTAIATSFALSEGAYLISIEEMELRPLEPASLRVGRPVDGELTADDPMRYFEPAHLDLYELELDVGQRVVIRMSSAVLNSYLWVVGPTGEVLVEDDDSGGGLDALLELTAQHSGVYTVVATSYPGLTGPYQLSVEDRNELDRSSRLAIEVGGSVVGVLEPGDGITPVSGSYRDTYGFTGSAGDQIEIRLESVEIDPYLMLVAPSGGLLAQDDDGGSGLNSRIQAILPEDGTYILHATSYRPAIGQYELSVEAFRPHPVVPQPVQLGAAVEGELTLEDVRSPRYGTLVDVFELDGEQGMRVAVQLSSISLDPYLVVIDPNGEVLAEDDDGGGGLNSRLEVTLPITGPYRILATTALFGEGAYTLSVEAEAAVSNPPIFTTPP